MDDRFAPGRIVTRAASRRTLLKRSGQLGAAVAITGATGGIDAMLAAAKAPALLQGTPAPSGKIKLLYQSVAPAEEARFEKFHELYPDIEIEAVAIEGDTWAEFGDAVATRIAGGETFDVLVIATEGQRVFASRGLLEPIGRPLSRTSPSVRCSPKSAASSARWPCPWRPPSPRISPR